MSGFVIIELKQGVGYNNQSRRIQLMSDFFDKLTSKGKELFSAAKDTANDLIEKGKDKAEEMKLNHDLNETYAKLGELFFEREVNGAEAEGLDALLEKAKEIKGGLADLVKKAEEAAAAAAAKAAEKAEKAASVVEEKVEEAVETVEEAVDTVEETVEEVEEEMVTCPVCGAKFPKGTEKCPICGASLL